MSTPQALAARINSILRRPAPVPGTRANGWFGGYGCRWCEASRAWFTVLPFEEEPAALEVARLFLAGNARTVTVTNEAGGLGLQVSAYV